MRENKLKENKGITLIALVITIIVLIILAGVSVAMLVGPNGILTQAKEAAEKTAEAEAEERVKLAVMASYDGAGTIDEEKVKKELEAQGTFSGTIPGNITFDGYKFYISETGEVKRYIPRPIEKDKTTSEIEVYSETENTEIADNYWNKIVIPAGFGIATESGNDVTEGIVVEDKDKGNQFVWVPVGNIKINDGGETKKIVLSRYEFDSNGIANQRDDEYAISNQYKELSESTKGNTVAKDLADFEIKTKASGGYYIARYEASNNNGVVESKADKTTWTYINQPADATAAQTMNGEEKPFTSDLINSLAWDTALVYIQTFSGDQDYSMQGSLYSSKQNTGESGDQQLKIYDMASNVLEWSTETSTLNLAFPCVGRGGGYYNSSNPSSIRIHGRMDHSESAISFRPLLYL